MSVFQTKIFQTTCIIFIQLAVVSMLMFSACGGDDVTGTDEPEGHGVVEIVIEPKEATLEAGEHQEFSAFALNADGDTVDTSDLNIEWEWWSDDPDVFTVEQGGLATGHNSGEAFCIIEATILVGKSNFTGRDSAFVMVF